MAGQMESTASGQTSGQTEEEDPTAKGIHVYISPTTYHSHRVMLALYEKGVNFTTHNISLLNYEQFSPCYLKLNPRGEVPTLKNGENIITDSGKIIDYLDDNYFCTKGETPRLIPEDAALKEKVLHFRELLQGINGNLVYFGSVFHPQFLDNPKAPFNIPLIRKRIKAYRKKYPQKVREMTEQNAEYRENILMVAKEVEDTVAIETDVKQFSQHLDRIDVILDEVEKELETWVAEEKRTQGTLDGDSLARGIGKEGDYAYDEAKHWLCGEQFTVADIYLASALERLNFCGYEKRFWENGKRPYLADYYKKLLKRDSYCRATDKIPLTYRVASYVYNWRYPIFLALSTLFPIWWIFM